MKHPKDPHKDCIDRHRVDAYIRRHTLHTQHQLETLKRAVEKTFNARPFWNPIEQLFYFQIPDGRIMNPVKPSNEKALRLFGWFGKRKPKKAA